MSTEKSNEEIVVLAILIRYNLPTVRRTNNPAVVELQNISKRLARLPILTNISITVYQGEKIGIAGPIGVGKTTLLYIMLGLITPDTGTIKMFSLSFETHRQYILQRVNFASSALKLNGYASVYENLLTFARLYRVPNPKHKIEKLVHNFGIEYLLKKNLKVYKLSAGENSKVNICKALLNNPEVLFLDEITAYLDPKSEEMLRDVLKKQTLQTVLFASHNLQELRRFCTKILFLKKGKIQYFGPMPSAKRILSYYG